MNILILYGPHEAPAIQDIYFNNPFRVLEREGLIRFDVVDISSFTKSRVREFSLIIISRIFTPEALDLIHFCRKEKKPVLFFFDDDILNFPVEYYLDNEPFYKIHEELIISILKQATALVVSTGKLKDSYLHLNEMIYVTPPCLDLGFIKENGSGKPAATTGQAFTIGYAGSFGHVVDFRFMEQALLDFYEQHYPEVRIEFMGCIPEAFGNRLQEGHVSLVHWQPDYNLYLKNILRARWDIALCPVIDSSYTSHKTNIKFLEYSAAGIPGIFSNISIYSGDIDEGQSGFLANNDYKSWKAKLEYVFKQRKRLPEVGSAGYDYVTTKYSNLNAAETWKVILKGYAKTGIAGLAETYGIYYQKIRRYYSRQGLTGVSRKAGRFVKRLMIASRLRKENSRSDILRTVNLEYEVVFDEFKPAFESRIIRKQILFIVPWLSVGGGDMVNLNIVQNLDPDRFSVHFITTEKSMHEWDKKFREITNNIFHLRRVLDEAEHFWEYNNFILEYIRRSKPDIIVISNSAIGYTCIPAIRDQFPYVKLMDILHGQGGAREGGGFPEFSRPYHDYLSARITINRYLANYIEARFGLQADGFRVIHNGIDTEKFNRSHQKKRGPFTVKFIGRLTYEKHPEKVIDIAAKVLAGLPGKDILFEIVGDGPMYGELQHTIKSQMLSAYIKLKGYRENIHKELLETDIVLLCSEMEGLPLVLLEAMSMSIPCVASEVGGIPELIDHGVNGFLVPPGKSSETSFARFITFLYNGRQEHQDMGIAARLKIEQEFSITKMRDAYLELFNGITP